METTIKIHEETKTELDLLREYKNESYDEIIKKLVYIVNTCKKEPQVSQEAVQAIEKARERLKQGKLLNETEARKRFGVYYQF